MCSNSCKIYKLNGKSAGWTFKHVRQSAQKLSKIQVQNFTVFFYILTLGVSQFSEFFFLNWKMSDFANIKNIAYLKL